MAVELDSPHSDNLKASLVAMAEDPPLENSASERLALMEQISLPSGRPPP